MNLLGKIIVGTLIIVLAVIYNEYEDLKDILNRTN
jgi:hypothetical protein